ncbi:hypothetical protein D3870_20635 [Noviherbaspirillum cavernae]|uniref:Glycolipid-binding domain-containing protein n=1 Tax=Noviherbaspirillum cavernae TaxID=2320862 RepID=A0A418WVR8_9BURK|nr:putative glycolipid-binding domain-containing protein [Noviherbaspirillum cavernae]RJF96795.1 hypothetical protein D3870_20635 [Noviherbaspirillum cavernae]
MNEPVAVFFWRKLDFPGHDACCLFTLADGYRLSGAAVFMESGRVCQLQYEVVADQAFRTRSASVAGFVGQKAVNVRIASSGDARWEVNGKSRPGLAGCQDVDLGFTPATNLLALRRLALEVGERAEAPAAYLAFPQMKVTMLPQHYKRLSRAEYLYEAPTVGYRGTLRVSPLGAIIEYPGLFQLESPTLPATGEHDDCSS